MATVKMTFSLDEATATRLRDTAETLRMPKSEVVREAIRDYSARADRLPESERRRLLAVFDELVPVTEGGDTAAVDAELTEVRDARHGGGRRSDPA